MKPGLVEALATAYAALIRRQRTASSAFVRWSSAHARAHEFAWMEPGREELMTSGCDIQVGPPLFTIPISITADGGTLLIHPEEELLRFNSLPFRSEFETAAQEAALDDRHHRFRC